MIVHNDGDDDDLNPGYVSNMFKSNWHRIEPSDNVACRCWCIALTIMVRFVLCISEASQARQEPPKDEPEEEDLKEDLSSVILVLHSGEEHEEEEEELLGVLCRHTVNQLQL